MDSQNAEKLSITLPAEMVRLAALDTAVANGIADAEAGRVRSVDVVRRDLRSRLGKKRSPA